MPIIRNGEIVVDDWATIEAERLPLGRPLLVTLAQWQSLGRSLRHWDQPLGLILKGDDSLEALRGELHRFQLIALDFPAFTDGRAYSQARLLRRRYGFAGELRAVGAVQQDQFLQMHRCGFDSYALVDAAAASAWLSSVQHYDGFYQPAERGAAGNRPALPPAPVVEQPAAAAWAY
ncbi:MAG: DUF934 domain-containing protein [Rhodospirillales bacterium]